MIRITLCLALLLLASCGGDVQPGGPGHEPPGMGTLNPVSGTRSNEH